MLIFFALLPVILAEPFWMTAELLRVDWREGCLTTAGCSRPRFKVVKKMLPLKEHISISWPVSEDFVQKYSRPFVSHWARGILGELILSCQVVGTDPTYGFPRICDQTGSIRVFEDKSSANMRRHQEVRPTTSELEEELDKKLIEIRARCFNVTIAVQKHTEKCPWCPDPLERTHNEQKLPEDVSSASPTSVFKRLLSDGNMPLSMIFLAGIAVISSLGIACVLIAFLRLRRSVQYSTTHGHDYSKQHSQPGSRSNLVKLPTRHGAPWEQTRPLNYWLSSSSRSEATTMSPLNSASSVGTRSSVVVPSFRTKCTIPQKQLYHQLSPNSSMESNDSALKVV